MTTLAHVASICRLLRLTTIIRAYHQGGPTNYTLLREPVQEMRQLLASDPALYEVMQRVDVALLSVLTALDQFYDSSETSIPPTASLPPSVASPLLTAPTPPDGEAIRQQSESGLSVTFGPDPYSPPV